MKMKVHAESSDVEKFKNYGKIRVYSYGERRYVELWIDIEEVIISQPDDDDGTLSIQRYSLS